MVDINISNIDGLEYLKTISNNSINLILTDPPYIISKDTGMNTFYNTVKDNIENNIEFVKTEKEWEEYKTKNDIKDDTNKNNYLKYGSIYGKKYCVKTQYGDWDSNFTMDILDEYIKQFYNKLKDGGTLILFFDIWKLTELKNLIDQSACQVP